MFCRTFGASKTIKLDEISRLLGFPGKFGIDGSEVEGLYKAGKLHQIRNYCETDVLNTYLLYYMQHCGQLTKERYEQAVSDVVRYVEAHGASRPHLADFRSKWLESEKAS